MSPHAGSPLYFCDSCMLPVSVSQDGLHHTPRHTRCQPRSATTQKHDYDYIAVYSSCAVRNPPRRHLLTPFDMYLQTWWERCAYPSCLSCADGAREQSSNYQSQMPQNRITAVPIYVFDFLQTSTGNFGTTSGHQARRALMKRYVSRRIISQLIRISQCRTQTFNILNRFPVRKRR